jgi:MFS family permease
MGEEFVRNPKALSYGLLVMTITHTLTHSFQNMHSTIYPTLKDEFLLSNQQIGLISAIPSLCSALLAIPTGLLSDRIGSKKMIAISIIVAILGAILASLSNSPLMLIVAISLLYLNTTIYHPAAYSFTTYLFEPKDRSKALGIHGGGGTFGMAIGPISISLLMGVFMLGWRQVYFAWVIPLILGLVAVFFIKYVPTGDIQIIKSSPDEPKQATKLLTTSLLMFLTFGGLRTVAQGMMRTFLSIWLVNTRGFDLTLTGLIIGSSFLMGIIAAPVGGVFAARVGEKKWTTATLLISYSCFSLAFFIPGTIPFIILYLGYGFFNLLSMAANSAIMAKLSPSKQRGLGFALYFLPGSIMGAIAPMIAAYIADIFGIFPVFLASMSVFSLAWLLLVFGVKVD